MNQDALKQQISDMKVYIESIYAFAVVYFLGQLALLEPEPARNLMQVGFPQRL